MATVLDRLVTELAFDDRRGEALNRVEKQVARVRGRLERLSNVFAGVGAALTAVGAGAIREFTGFESELAKIEGLVGISRDQLDAWKQDVLAISRETGQAPRQLAQALFFITSAGLRGADAIDALRASAKASAAGLGEQAVIADLLTSAMNAYGPETLSAAKATDILTEAVRLGKLAPDTLASSMGRLLPIASAMGVEFNEVAGLMAAMSRTGTNAEEGVTQLNAVMAGVLKPAQGAVEALTDVGLTFDDLRRVMRNEGIFRVLETLNTAFNGSRDAIAEVFPNIRALRGIFDLLGPGIQQNRALLAEMADSAGVLDEAFAASANTLQFRWNQTMAGVRSGLLQLGDTLRPVADTVLSFAQRVTGAFAMMPEPVRILTAAVVALGPVLLGAAVAIRGVAFALNAQAAAAFAAGASNVTAGSLISGAWAAAAGVVGRAATAMRVAALASFTAIQTMATRLYLTLRFAGLSGLMATIFAPFKAAGVAALAAIRTGAISAAASIRGMFLALGTGAVWSAAAAKATAAFRLIAVGARVAWIAITGPFGIAAAIIIGAIALIVAAWKPVSTFLKGFFSALREGASRIRDAFGRLLDALGPVGSGIRAVGNGIMAIFRGIGRAFRWLVNLFGDQEDAGKNFGAAFVDALVFVIDSVARAVETVKGFITAFFDAGKALVTAIANGIKAAAGAVWDAVKGVGKRVMDFLPGSDAREGPLSTLTLSGQRLVETVADGVKRAAPLEVAVSAALALPALPDLAGVEMAVKPVAEGMREVAMAVRPVLDGSVGDIGIPASVPDLAGLAAPLQAGPLPVPGAIDNSQRAVSVTVEGVNVTVQVADGDVREIGDRIGDELKDQIRRAVEQADSIIRA